MIEFSLETQALCCGPYGRPNKAHQVHSLEYAARPGKGCVPWQIGAIRKHFIETELSMEDSEKSTTSDQSYRPCKSIIPFNSVDKQTRSSYEAHSANSIR